MNDRQPGIKVTIAGGGTGGHVLPAVAVVNELRSRDQLANALWLGSFDGVERQAAATASIPYVAIPTGKLRRYLSLENAIDLARIPTGVVAARKALRRYRPDVVLSTGGFVSVPTVVAARGISPVVTHEQTAILGLATRINARFAEALAISFAETESEARKIHRHVVVTGNPVRREIASGDRRRGLERWGFAADLPVIYVTGGARGASPLNQRVAAVLADLLEIAQVVHQTGPANANRDAEELNRKREALPETIRRRYAVVDFVRDELADTYAMADLVIGRAGAGTIAELAYLGKPAVLIPLPGTGGDEQAMNARVLERAGAAVVLPQAQATPERLLAEMRTLLSDAPRRQRMAAAAASVAAPDAAARLADLLLDVAEDRGRATRR